MNDARMPSDSHTTAAEARGMTRGLAINPPGVKRPKLRAEIGTPAAHAMNDMPKAAFQPETSNLAAKSRYSAIESITANE